jgi:3-oxoacyl-[acyl-carrier-protein] synthase II
VRNTSNSPLAITGWSAVSPFGIGRAAFVDGVRSASRAVVALDSGPEPTPLDQAGTVPGFEVRSALGPKNTRSMDRATGLAVVAVGLVLEEARLGGREVGPRDIGLVLGTSTGSVKSMMDFTRDSLTGAKPYHVDPARFPNTVMNRACGQCAIWYGLTGPNTTIAGGQATGLLSLQYALRLQRRGHAETVMVGAVEEYSTQRAWLEWLAREPDEEQRPLGEGCAVFLVEDPASAADQGREVQATVLGLRFAVGDPAGPDGPARAVSDALAGCIRKLLAEADASPGDVWAVAVSGQSGWCGTAEAEAVAASLPDAEVLAPVSHAIGDTSAASGSFQLAALLSATDAGGRLGIVTSLDMEGQVGCALIQLNDTKEIPQ